MKTPVLTYNKDRCELLDSNIATQLQIIKSCAPMGESVYDSVKRLLSSLCYKLFKLQNNVYVNGKAYTVADLCLPVHGMFQQSMITFVHNMINAVDSGAVNLLLRDAVSYELLQMLYSDPCAVYAALLYYYATLNYDEELIKLATDMLLHPTGRPTLDWETMYLQFTERSAING